MESARKGDLDEQFCSYRYWSNCEVRKMKAACINLSKSFATRESRETEQ